EVKVSIRPLTQTATQTGILYFDGYDSFGKGLLNLIQNRTKLFYSETIVEAHPQFANIITPPLIIVEYPKKERNVVENIGTLKDIDKQEFLQMRKLRAELPKKNPDNGIQKAYFEGYGFNERNLIRFEDLINQLDNIWIEDGYEPFLRYGHGPCKWYCDDTPVYGLIMHAREVASNQTSKQTFMTLRKILQFCEKEDIVPKPEHKWPYMTSKKKKRLRELSEIIGSEFNKFILEYSLDDLQELVL
ncbi:MAG: hypothetical protein ACTSW4_02645, partial [Candidatus Ranarchaeia archaeon]